MNVVIFGNGFGKPRQLNLSGTAATFLGLFVAGVLSTAAFFGGYWYSARIELRSRCRG